jgi:hypothetical protein
MNAVEEFILYDNIEYTKKGWINRNRILVNGQDSLIAVPLKKDSDYLQVKDRYLADLWPNERKKLINRITEAYRKSPYFQQVFPLIEQILNFQDLNLFAFILNSLEGLRDYLEIKSRFIISSSIPIDHQLKAQDKVIALCKARSATQYINPIGGLELYDQDSFRENGMLLKFIKTSDVNYQQFGNTFIPMLSIIDVMMFNSVEKIREFLNTGFEYIEKH